MFIFEQMAQNKFLSCKEAEGSGAAASLTGNSASDGNLGIMGNVSDLLSNYKFSGEEEQVFINVGSRGMIENVYRQEMQLAKEENIWVSIEYQTSCGVGICGKCATEAGPFFCVFLYLYQDFQICRICTNHFFHCL